MSAAAILKGVEARLRDLMDDPAGKIIGVQFDGRPPPFSGQFYFAVHWTGARSDDQNPQTTDHAHGVTVTITAKMAYSPKDRVGDRTTKANQLLQLAEDAVAAIHGKWEVVNAANDVLPGTARYVAIHGGSATTNGFSETLVSQGYGPIEEKGGDWLGSENAHNVLTCEVRFGEARRVTVLY